MRFRLYTIIALLFIGTCAGQTFFPRKDLIFGQVAVGDAIYTQITATNRGVYPYAGTLFFRKGQGEPWTPLVDGTVAQNGQREIELKPGETITLKITGTDEQPAGTVMLMSDDLLLDNFIEGNLTYFFRASNQITDSVGVASSQEFYLATLPFENFSTVALALVNGNVNLDETLEGRSNANVTLRLYDSDGDLVATSNDPDLSPMVPMAHIPRFLPQFFPAGTQLGRGRVEIVSDVPIFGTALTFLYVESGTQSSSLSLEPSTITYSIRLDSEADDVLEGEITLWAEGYFVKGYLVISTVNGGPVQERVFTFVNGQLIDGILELSFYAQGEAFQVLADEVSLVLEILGGFSFSGTDPFGGNFVMTSLIDPGATLPGIFSLIKIQ